MRSEATASDGSWVVSVLDRHDLRGALAARSRDELRAAARWLLVNGFLRKTLASSTRRTTSTGSAPSTTTDDDGAARAGGRGRERRRTAELLADRPQRVEASRAVLRHLCAHVEPPPTADARAQAMFGFAFVSDLNTLL